MTALLGAIFLASLLGSLHCVGMCGPLVAIAVGLEGASWLARMGLQLAYHGGRLVSYVLLGALGGGLGATLDSGAGLVGLQRTAAVVAGLTMAVIGLVGFLRAVGVALPAAPLPGPVRRLLIVGQKAALGLRPLPRAATVGLLSGILPCGWLYAFAVTAFGTGGAFVGALVMLAFWAGTVPALLVLGVGFQGLGPALGRRVPILTSLLVLAIGLYTIAGRTSLRLDQVRAPEPPAVEAPTPSSHGR